MQKNRRSDRRKAGMLLCFLLTALVLFVPKPASAALKNTFHTENNKTYYYGWNGKKVTGWKTIKGKTYYFTRSGVQRIGWQAIDGKIYYFKNAFGSRGYMRSGCTVSGVRLSKTGAASQNGRNKRKSQLLARCQAIREKLIAKNPKASKETQLRLAFQYVMKQKARNIHSFTTSSGNWDMYYGEYMLNHVVETDSNGLTYGYGDCYCYAAFFGYMANVIGYNHVKVESSGGHGWVHIGNNYYDPNWALVEGFDKCYAAPASLSGVSGRPRWATNAAYVKDLSK